jgi:sRNA-binding protein
MTQATINSNGHGHGPSPTREEAPGPDRRQTAAPPSVRPEVLVERHVENARRQLAEARERLKAARRRVVQLEDAVGNWERFAAELRRTYGNDTPLV